MLHLSCSETNGAGASECKKRLDFWRSRDLYPFVRTYATSSSVHGRERDKLSRESLVARCKKGGKMSPPPIGTHFRKKKRVLHPMAEDGWKGKRRGRPWGDKCMRSHPKSAGGEEHSEVSCRAFSHLRTSRPFRTKRRRRSMHKEASSYGKKLLVTTETRTALPSFFALCGFPSEVPSWMGMGERAGELWAHFSLPPPLCASDCENASPLSMQCSQRRPPGLYLCGTIKRHQGKRG